MQHAPKSVTSPSDLQHLRRLDDPEYRHAYVEENVRTNIAFQVHALRTQRNWTQKQLAAKLHTAANTVSRLEDPEYGRLTVTTLLEIAAAFDVALLLQFVEHDDWFARMADVSPSALQKRSFNLQRLLSLARISGEAPHPQRTTETKTVDALGDAYTLRPFTPSEPQGRQLRRNRLIDAALSDATPDKNRAFL